MSFLRFEHIKKIYPNGFEAVKDFCLDVEKGEFIVLVGPSGCGKTTTLRMLAGLEDISSGTISINDKVINEYEPKDRDIAMVFQNSHVLRLKKSKIFQSTNIFLIQVGKMTLPKQFH